MAEEELFNKTFDGFEIRRNILIGQKVDFDVNQLHIAQRIYKSLSKTPENIGQIDAETGRNITNAEMLDQIIRLSLWLKKQGLGKNDIITQSCPICFNAYLPMISSFFIGAVFNPWPANYLEKDALLLMELIQPKVIFTCPANVRILKKTSEQLGISPKLIIHGQYPGLQSLEEIVKEQSSEEVSKFQIPKVVDDESLALIVFTSGTTGIPKGVMHTYKRLKCMRIDNRANSSINMWYTPLHTISSITSTIRVILAGNSTRILHKEFDPTSTCKIIQNHQVNGILLYPHHCAILQKSRILEKNKLENLKWVMTGGARINKTVLAELRIALPHADVQKIYGMSELLAAISLSNEKVENLDSVGFVSSNTQIKVLDHESSKPLGPNKLGEILLKIPGMMVGYYKDPIETQNVIDNGGWLHSGDEGYYNENGELFITDRIRERMKYRLLHVCPSEIENLLNDHKDVLIAVVVPVPDVIDGERPMAFVKKVSGSTLTEDFLVEMSAQLGEHKKLRGGVKFLDNFPTTATGKIDRKGLKEMAKNYERKN